MLYTLVDRPTMGLMAGQSVERGTLDAREMLSRGGWSLEKPVEGMEPVTTLPPIPLTGPAQPVVSIKAEDAPAAKPVSIPDGHTGAGKGSRTQARPAAAPAG